jgi:hypothetical protein
VARKQLDNGEGWHQMNFGLSVLWGMTCRCDVGERESRVRWSSSVAKVGGGGTKLTGRQ